MVLYQNILAGKTTQDLVLFVFLVTADAGRIEFPRHVSKTARDLISKLLQVTGSRMAPKLPLMLLLWGRRPHLPCGNMQCRAG